MIEWKAKFLKTFKNLVIRLKSTLLLSLSFCLFEYAYAGKKILIFEDAQTLGKGGFQNENYLTRKEPKTTEYTFNLTYGLMDRVDVGLNFPFKYTKKLDSSNVFLDLKWKFFEAGDTKGAFKLSSELPTKEGVVKYGPSLTLQTSFENLSLYATSFYEFRDKVFSQYASAEWNLTKELSFIATGFYISEDSQVGMIVGFALSKGNWEIALGIQRVFKDKEKASTLAGLTIRFK